MSWARIDDTFWDHPKTIALIEQGNDGLAAVGAFWVINAYCNRMARATFSIWEAAMLLRRSKREAAEILLRLCAAPASFEHGFLLQSNGEAYIINSFDEYRSKNEAKAAAGSQGGRKSGETRRRRAEANAKQSRSKVEAKPKQTRSPDPVPDTPELPVSRDPGTRNPTTSLRSSDGELAGKETGDDDGDMSRAELTASINAVIEHYRTHHDKSRPGDKERRRIRLRLGEGYSVADLCKAIDGCHKTPFNLGENERGQKFLSLDLIMRDSDHVARFIEHDDDPPKSERKHTVDDWEPEYMRRKFYDEDDNDK